jgi:hypothetical protein
MLSKVRTAVREAVAGRHSGRADHYNKVLPDERNEPEPEHNKNYAAEVKELITELGNRAESIRAGLQIYKL